MRLTKRLSDGQAALECRACPLQSNGCTLYACRQMLKDRLAAYEDTGLEPGEAGAEWHASPKTLGPYREPGPAGRLYALAQADGEGRCVVLPCKIGDPVFMPTGRGNAVTGYEEDECDGFHIARDGILQVKAKCWTGNHGTYGVPGKTAFLTREEADAAVRRHLADASDNISPLEGK